MKIRDLTLATGLFICSVASFAQPSQGTWLLNTAANFSSNLSNPADNYYVRTSFIGGRFITSKVLLGSGVDVFRSFYRFDDPVFPSRSSYTVVGISPFARYYFPRPNQPWQYFLEAGTGIQSERVTFSNPFANTTETKVGFLPFAGVGVGYFVHPSIALEGKLQYRGAFGVIGGQIQNFNYQLGVEFFLSESVRQENDGLPIIGKGAWLIGLNGFGGITNLGKSNDGFGSLSPSIGYFLFDRLVLGANLQLAFANQNAIITPEPFARAYIGSKESVVQPFVGAGLGTRFQFAKSTSDPAFFGLNFNSGLGVDWFVTPRVALETLLQYNIRQLEESNSLKFIDLSVGFQFFLQSNKK
ncbi:MAG TPA: hypothetical protein PKD70_15180 [Saprospiraceae bacterium]|nr:hypothetical protein [Saprospiraceae bacterium]HMP15220.1 hypothetical protein [Saprospiraceae bacterium]